MQEYRSKTVRLPQGESGEFVITKGLNSTLIIFQVEKWERFKEGVLAKLPLAISSGRLFARFFMSSAFEFEVNADGELYVPEAHWEYLTMGKECETVKVYSVDEYLNKRKEDIQKTERDVLNYVSFVVVGQV